MRYVLQTLLPVLLISAFASAQESSRPTGKEKAEYQDRQRILRLANLKFRIANLEDAPMRCFLNIAILRFVANSNAKEYLGLAESAAVACLQDIDKNVEQFGEMKGRDERNSILVALDKSFPDIAKKLEAKYGAKEVASAKDFDEVETTKDLKGFASRISARILNGDVTDVPILYARLRLKNPTLAITILSPLISYFERNQQLNKISDTFGTMGMYFLAPEVPKNLKVRFYRIAISLAEQQLFSPESSSSYATITMILESCLSDIDQILPTEEGRARSMFLALASRRSERLIAYQEINRRILASDDRLGQTIAEAEAATDKLFKMSLWFSASQIAVEQKKFSIAVDCRLKWETSLENAHDYFLLNDVVPGALAAKDFPNADYAIKHLKSGTYRAEAELKVATKFVELGDLTAATERLDACLSLLNRLDATSDGVRIMSSAVSTALKIQKFKAFDIARDTLRTANRLKMDGADKNVGTPERTKFVNGPLLWNAYNLSALFRSLSKADFSLAAPLEYEVESKSWRLVAEIVLETHRSYSIPANPDKKSVP